MKNLNAIVECIQSRRSTKTALMNGTRIPDELIQQLLELADWAPTHAMTEPWRFIVYSGEALQQFAQQQADLYKANTPAENFKEVTYQNIRTNCEKVSHNIVAYMKRGNNPNIPALEEVCATACAVENLLLGASEAGLAALWSTGGVTLKPAFKEFLELGPDDQVLGQIYLGYSDSVKEGTRKVPLTEKVKWMR